MTGRQKLQTGMAETGVENGINVRESEERFFKLFHISSNPMSITSINGGRIIDVNEATVRLFGYKREHLIGRNTIELHIWADLEERESTLRILNEAGSVQNKEVRLRNGFDEIRTVLLSADQITIGDEPCLLCVLVDITAREREERALKQSEEKYRTLVENSLQGLSIIQDNRFVFCNKAFAEMSGYAIDELLSLSPEQMNKMLHDDDRPAVTRWFVAHLQGKVAPSRFEYRGIKKDGSEFWVEILISPVEYEAKPALQMVYLDITERKKAEAEARESGERLQLALEAADMTSWDLDVQTGDVKDEDRWLRRLGYEVGEIEPNVRKWNSLMHPEDLPALQEAAAAHLEGRTAFYEVEHRIRDKSGSWVWVLDRGKLISRDSSGKPLRTVGVHFNITGHKLAIEQTNRLAKEQRAILNTISMGICYLESGHLQWVNPAFLQMFGYTPEELPGFDASRLLSSEGDFQKISGAGSTILETGGVFTLESEMKKKDGSLFWCSIAGEAINPANLDAGSIWVFQDITGRRRTEAALRENEEKFRLLLQNSNDIIAILDDRGSTVYISDPSRKILGYKPEEMIGTDSFAYLHPDDVDSNRIRFSDLIQRPGEIRRFEFRFRHKNGSWVPIEAVGTNRLHDPAVKGIVLNVRDISERKKLEEQLQQAIKMEAVGVLAGGVAHDFNNLLSVINGYTELLLEDIDPNDSMRQDLEQVAKAGSRAASLTSQLLAFSRKQMLQPEILDMNVIVKDMSSMLRRVVGEDIELEAITQPDLGAINADPGQIQQIIMNLAANARDAMPNGGKLTIQTANLDIDDNFVRDHPMVTPGAYVMIAVIDNGLGMSAATQSHIFEPFFTTKGKSKGTGLGLSTVYGIVRQSNGFIWVSSEPGKGTTFKIYFPRTAARTAHPSAAVKAEHASGGFETILIAEDEDSVRALACRVLREQGYNVLEARDGMEALNIARDYAGVIHLVLSDVVMPGMNGSALVTQIQAARPGIKSLYVSGYTDSALVHHGVLDSNIAFLQKPFSIQSLISKVKEAIDN